MISNRGLAVKELESKYLRKGAEDFNIGDTVKVHFKIKEGKRERVQVFEGVVIAMNGTSVRSTLTVRKLSFNNINVERVFPLHSPKIDKITVSRQGRVRRAKLYYLRNRKGKAAQVKRLMDNKSKVSATPKTSNAKSDISESSKESADSIVSEANPASPDIKQNS